MYFGRGDSVELLKTNKITSANNEDLQNIELNFCYFMMIDL